MKKSCLFLLWLLVPLCLQAAHIVGSEVSYRYLGSDQYEITFRILRDDNSGGAPLDAPLHYTIFDENTDTIVGVYFVDYLLDTVPATQGDPCVVPPSNFIIQMGVYIDTVTLPFIAGNYYVTYQRCCWANDISNIADPGDEGLTVTCVIPGSGLVSTQNSSSSVDALPPIILCTNKEFTYNFTATDPDGDSLVYTFCDPIGYDQMAGNTSPNPDFPRPYQPVVWEPGFSGTAPFGPTTTVSIDPQTGFIEFTPDLVGRFLAAVCVSEFRNGVLLTERNVIMLFQIVQCDQVVPFEITAQNEGIVVGGQGGGTEPEDLKIVSEDCGSHTFSINRNADTSELIIELIKIGTAINGVDYNFLPDTIIIPVGVEDTSFTIFGLADNLVEPTEFVTLILRYFDICTGEYDSLVTRVEIFDYQPLELTLPKDSLNFCQDLGETVKIESITKFGIPPYQYEWYSPATDFLPPSPTLQFSQGVVTETVTPFTLRVVDQCGKDTLSNIAYVWDQCPIIVPNVVTVNGDYINDVFLIKNLENYDAVRLKIWNRWGNLLYENDAYKNNWLVTHRDGTPFNEGVYFYTAEVVNSDKYTYDDQEKTIYQAQGFFHVISNKK